MVTAAQVRAIVLGAGFKLDGYAQSYLRGLTAAEDAYGEEGVRVQILYILNNVRARGPAQVQARKQLMQLSKKEKRS